MVEGGKGKGEGEGKVNGYIPITLLPQELRSQPAVAGTLLSAWGARQTQPPCTRPGLQARMAQ